MKSLSRTIHFKLILLLFLLFNLSAFGQIETCGTDSMEPLLPPTDEPCLNPDSIMAKCEDGMRVWVKVNFHFFLPDDCEGSIDPNHPSYGFNTWGAAISADSAFIFAEYLIERANSVLEDNKIQRNVENWPPFNQPDTVAPCNPIRYLLNGVYIHCDPIANIGVVGQSAAEITTLNNNFGVNTDSEFNVYLLHNQTASGDANGIRGNSMVIGQWGNWGLFNHEMGHVFGLQHSWANDRLDDTPPIHFKYDFNCDGDLNENYTNGVGRETEERQCKTIYDVHPPIDYDGDGIDNILDPCNPDPPCKVYPCCLDEYFNNNVMSYGRYLTAWTNDQIRLSLNNFNVGDRCDFIEYIGDDCPPPVANIGLLPKIDTSGCAFCFYLEASAHDDSYNVEFFDSNGDPVHNMGWRAGPAKKYCISKNPAKPNEYLNGFEANQTYTIRLSVNEGGCSKTATEEVDFTLPDLNCSEEETNDDFLLKTSSPNPHINSFTLNYQVLQPGQLQIILVNATNPAYSKVILSSQSVSDGDYQYDVSTSDLPDGVYALIFMYQDVVYSNTIVKGTP